MHTQFPKRKLSRKTRRLAIPAALLLCLAAMLFTACDRKGSRGPSLFTDTLDPVEPNENEHVTMKVMDTGYDIYAPVSGGGGYRYGPSIMYYADGSIDAYFATPGAGGEWDWFTYKHSGDGGKTWSKEVVVLQPTPDSMDHFSVCDPGAVYFGGYYYLGYTSTIVGTYGGINNNVFVARSKNPEGPYEKWNGEGWGGDPQPIIYYDESDSAWGAGEISFVVLDDTLYCYYTWTCPDGSFTKVATADTCENWPATMEYRGVCYGRGTGQDSCDVVYIEDCAKFVAFSTDQRFTENSGIALFESNDGIHFTQVDVIRTNVYQYCHNMGISKRPDGHIQLKDPLFIGYGYHDGSSGNWGRWATHFQPVELSTYIGEVTFSNEGGKGTLCTDYFWEMPEELWPVAINTNPHKIETYAGNKTYLIEAIWLDTTLTPHVIEDTSKITFTDYDKSLISFKGTTMYMKKAGETDVTMHYKGLRVTFKVCIRPDDFIIGGYPLAIETFRAVNDDITVYLQDGGGTHKRQIRGYVVFADQTWGEAYNDSTKAHTAFPAMVPRERYEMTYEVADESIISVSDTGIITANAVGQTSVTVTITGGLSFTVNVTVEASRD